MVQQADENDGPGSFDGWLHSMRCYLEGSVSESLLGGASQTRKRGARTVAGDVVLRRIHEVKPGPWFVCWLSV